MSTIKFNYMIGPIGPIDYFQAGMLLEDLPHIISDNSNSPGEETFLARTVSKVENALNYVEHSEYGPVREYYLYAIPTFIEGYGFDDGASIMAIVKGNNNGGTFVFYDSLSIIPITTLQNWEERYEARVVKLK